MSQDKPVLTVEQIERLRPYEINIPDGIFLDIRADILRALCDLALSALERQGSGKCCCVNHVGRGSKCLQCPIHGTPPPQAQDAQTGEKPFCEYCDKQPGDECYNINC